MKEKHLAMKKIGSALGLGILLFFAVSVESKAQGLEKALITHSSESISITPLIYGIEKGFYRKEGVDLQFRILRGDLAVGAMLSGKEVDYIYGAGTAFLTSNRQRISRGKKLPSAPLVERGLPRPGRASRRLGWIQIRI